MDPLEVDFAGLKLKNPIIAASAPPTEALKSIVKCAEAGVGAIITKTSANYDFEKLILGARRTYVDSRGLWVQGTFRHETLPIQDGMALVKQAVRAVNVPIIASVGSLDLDAKDWLDSCWAMQDAGASMVQLDLFYVPQPRSSLENTTRLIELLSLLSSRLDIPIAPKLNLDFPPYHAANLLRETGVACVFAIDSIRVPVPIDIHRGGAPRINYLRGARDCSLLGEWQKPLTLQYTSVLFRELGLPISAGGGFLNVDDVVEAIMWGATTVQFASLIMKYGYGQINKVIKQLRNFLVLHGYNSVAQIKGLAQTHIREAKQETFEHAHASIDDSLCIGCGRCARTVFCGDISFDNGKAYIERTCDGCGYCQSVCPIPGALRIVAGDVFEDSSLHPGDLL